MARFPRKIKGLYAMLGRQDYENIYVMFSDHLHFWQDQAAPSGAKVPLGILADGQLRLTD